jgi:hypothetical protein
MSELVPQNTLGTETTALAAQANAVVVTNDAQKQDAANFLKAIKEKAKAVTDFFAAPKKKADELHKAICEQEKTILQPLKDAETIIKRTVGEYDNQQRMERNRLEQEARRRQQEEADRLLAEAAAAEQSGDTIGAETLLASAEIVADMKPTVTAPAKTSGISTRYKWVAEVVADAAVPTHINGLCIRPIDIAALNKLAQASNGTLDVPGVKFKQEPIITVR